LESSGAVQQATGETETVIENDLYKIVFTNFVKLPYWVIGGGVAAIVLLSLGILYWKHRSKVREPASPQQAEVQTAKTQPFNQTERPTANTREDNRELDAGETSDRFGRNPPNRKHSSSMKAKARSDRRRDVKIRDFNVPKAAVSQHGSEIANDAPPSAGALPLARESTLISSVLSIPASLPPPPLKFQGITPGRLEHKVEPIYPAQARMARVGGAVTLRATVGTDGKVREVRVISGNPLLVHAAVDAVSQWRYKPYQLNNQPVAVQTGIVIIFRLP
jgi:TonB family protein